jgi:predicted Zn finger-like uncharacterized protein
MSELITRCPECATAFRLASAQLDMADGMVRCGKCMAVFDAENNVPLPVVTALLHNEFTRPPVPEKQPPTGRRLTTAMVVVLGALLLAGQYSYFFSRELSQISTYRQPLRQFCNLLGCQIDPFRDLNQLSIKRFIVRPDPNQPIALAVDLIIENSAAFDQPYPKLFIRFEDLQNELVAQRIFSAQQYLMEDTASLPAKRNAIPARARTRVNFSLLDPGATAVNYSVELVE